MCIEPTFSWDAALDIIVDSLTSQSLDCCIDNHLVATALPRILERKMEGMFLKSHEAAA
jgi:hypothetical protein